jgi:PKD repeat protein
MSDRAAWQRVRRASGTALVALCVLAVVLAPATGVGALSDPATGDASTATADTGDGRVSSVSGRVTLAPGGSSATTTDPDDGNATRGPNASRPRTAVSLAARSTRIDPGGRAIVDVVVDAAADDGVGAFTFTVESGAPGTASITDFRLYDLASAEYLDVSHAPDNSSVTVRAARAAWLDGTRRRVLGSVVVDAESNGTAPLSLSVDALGNQSGHPYAVPTTPGTAVTVGEPKTPTMSCSQSSLSNGRVSVSLVDGGRLFASAVGDADPSRAPQVGTVRSNFRPYFYNEGFLDAYERSTIQSTTLVENGTDGSAPTCTYRVVRTFNGSTAPNLTYVTETQLRAGAQAAVVNLTVRNDAGESIALGIPAVDRQSPFPNEEGVRLLSLDRPGDHARFYATGGAARGHAYATTYPGVAFPFGTGSLGDTPFVTAYGDDGAVTAALLEGTTAANRVVSHGSAGAESSDSLAVDVGDVDLAVGEQASWKVAVAPHSGGPTRGQRVVSDATYDFATLDRDQGPDRLVVSPNASDGNYTSLANAVANASVGEIIELRPGRYVGGVTLDKDVTVVAPDGATLDGALIPEAVDPNPSGIVVGRDVSPVVRNLTVTGYFRGVDARNTNEDWRLDNVTLADNGIGVDAGGSTGPWAVHGATVTESEFVGVRARGTTGAWSVHGSRLTANGWAVNATGATPAGEATRNWWGASDGPGGAFPGSGDGATGNVSVTPFYADAALTTLSEFDAPLNATFSVRPPAPTAGESATFDASNSSGNATVASYEWSFGDGSDATGEIATHAYADPGNYTVGLTVTGPNGTTANASSEVVVAAANATNATLRTGSDAANTTANLTFTGSDAAATVNGTVERYEWAFGDGTTATGASPTHTYDEPGTYTVTLTMVTADGGVETVADTVSVAGDRNETGTGNGTSVVERGNDPVYQTGRVTDAPATVSAGETVTVTGSVEAEIPDAQNNVVFGVVGLADGTVLGVSAMGTTGSGTVSTSVDVPSGADGQRLVWTFVPVLSADAARDAFTSEADRNAHTGGDLGIVVATVGGSGSGPDGGGNETLDVPEGVNRSDFESVAGSDDSVGRSDVLGTVRAYVEGGDFRGASLSRSEILSVVRYYIRS